MITPIEIQSKTFKSGGLGYDKKDVDGFLREVLRSYEQIYRENMELNDKVAVLTEGIQYYKTIEKTLQKALVLAEKTAEDTKVAALEKAKAIEKEANTRSQLIVADAKNELEHIHSQTVQLIQQYEKYKQQFKHLAQAQMELIESESFNINVARLDAFIDVKQARGNVAREAGLQGQQYNQVESRQAESRQPEQRQVEQRQTESRQPEQRQTEQRQTEQRQDGQRYSDNQHTDNRYNKHSDHKRSENKHRENKHFTQKRADDRRADYNQFDYNQVALNQTNQKPEQKYANQEEYQVEMEPSFFDALEQVSATQEDMDRSYGNGDRYAKEDEEDYPYDQKNDLENQDEFSFINLVDEED